MLIPVLALAMIQAPNPTTLNLDVVESSLQGAIRWQNAPAGAKSEAGKENFDTCFAYIEGFLDGVMDTSTPPSLI
jgi:hypothetical protein